MSFRARVLAAFFLLVAVPLGLFALGVRHEMGTRLGEQYQHRVEGMASVVRGDLEREARFVRRRLAALRSRATDDNRLRREVVRREGPSGSYLLDYAGRAMRTAGLDALQIQDAAGRILSSGHFRNEYGRLEPGLPEQIAATPEGHALAEMRRPEGPFLALVSADSFRVAGERFWLVGGVSVRERLLDRLSRGAGPAATLVYPGGRLAARPGGDAEAGADTAVVSEVPLPYFGRAADGGVRRSEARIVLTQSLSGLRALQGSVESWLLWALAATVAGGLLLAAWLSARLSRPLEELAGKTRALDLDRLDVDFATDRDDEVGALSRVLDTMTRRLQVSAARLRKAEREVTIGEMARQVNHDIRNGLAPLRNVLRHLEEAAPDPSSLRQAFRDRRDTLDAGLSYLEELAGQYSRISRHPEVVPCDLDETVRSVAAATGAPGVTVETELAGDLPAVSADPVALRRIVENLVRNAVEAVEPEGGRVTVRTGLGEGAGRGEAPPGHGPTEDAEGTRAGGGPEGAHAPASPAAVQLTVSDTGPGVPEEERDRVFRDFYTTKEGGTGLGLSIVRRLVSDLDGSVRLESGDEGGATFVVELRPARGPDTGGGGGAEGSAGDAKEAT